VRPVPSLTTRWPGPRPDPARTDRDTVAREGKGLLAFAADDAPGHDLRFLNPN
jgi:hypothetical protein